MNSIILTHYFDTKYKLIAFKEGKVNIGNYVFIGAGAIICNAVNIGDYSIVGAGAIVTKNIPSYEVWAGNPARFIKVRPGYEVEHEKILLNTSFIDILSVQLCFDYRIFAKNIALKPMISKSNLRRVSDFECKLNTSY